MCVFTKYFPIKYALQNQYCDDMYNVKSCGPQELRTIRKMYKVYGIV